MLRSKSLPPALPPGHVPRPRELFAAAFERRLTTVVAGPGFGKSTALGAWAAKVRCAWYTVDRPDSDPGQLAAGIVAALRVPLPGLTENAASTAQGVARG